MQGHRRSDAPLVDLSHAQIEVGGNLSFTWGDGGRSRRAAAAVLTVRADPVADAGFVGRADELAGLLGLLDPQADSPHRTSSSGPVSDAMGAATEVSESSAVVVSAVSGLPGVGKTALARAAARATSSRGWFPGGVLWADLHGYDPDRAEVVWPAQLWASLLRGLGVVDEQVPPSVAEQATVYHQVLDRLADAGRPVLLVLDNVADAEQVLEILPRGAGRHRALITSRDTLGELPGARLIDLDVLEQDTAVQLLALGVRNRLPADGRVAADPGAAARLVGLCGRLPLAVQIVAALLADEPDRPLAELAAELDEEDNRLSALDYGPRWAVRAAFDLSYRRLEEPLARLFGLLAAVPGTDVSLAVAAAVSDRPQSVVRMGLRRLCRAHLLEQQVAQPGQPVRWRMHDLIRLYAIERLDEEERAAGFARVLGYYRHTADLAARRFTALPGHEVPAGFATPQEAMAWVMGERASLVAAVVQAAERQSDDAIRLSVGLDPILSRAQALEDRVTMATAAVQAGHRASERPLMAAAWNSLGLALRNVRRFDEAIAAHEQDLTICREIGDRHSEGEAWGNLGLALAEARRLDEAIIAYEQAHDILRETRDRHGEGKRLGNLGLALQQAGRPNEAIAAHEQNLTICQEIGDRHGEGQAWNNLGLALTNLQRFDEAIAAHEQNLTICQETGDRHGEGHAWNNLGNALADVLRFDEAITALTHACDIRRETGDRHAEGPAWRDLGLALAQVWRFDEAITALTHACDICQETGDRHTEGPARYNLGFALGQLRRFDEAITALTHACDIFRETGDRHDEGQAWGNLGFALRQVRRFDEAIDALTHACDICQEIGDRHGEGQAWSNLGFVYAEFRQRDLARHAWGSAVDLFIEVGNYEWAAVVRQWLAGLDR